MASPSQRIISISNSLDRLMTVISGAALAVLVFAVMLQVVARYVFASPPSWTEELARYSMIWAGLTGATMSFKRRLDPRLFDQRALKSPFLLKASSVLQSLVVLVYLLPILWFCFFGPGANFARGFLTRHSRTMADAIDIPTLVVAISIPIMIVVVLVHLTARWSGDNADTDRHDEF